MRRLRIVEPCQLVLVSEAHREESAALVWAALAERARGTALAALARMIAAGVIDDAGEEVS